MQKDNVFCAETYLCERLRHGIPYPNDGSSPAKAAPGRHDDYAMAFGVPEGHLCPSSLPYICIFIIISFRIDQFAESLLVARFSSSHYRLRWR